MTEFSLWGSVIPLLSWFAFQCNFEDFYIKNISKFGKAKVQQPLMFAL